MKNILKKFLIILIAFSIILNFGLISNAANELTEEELDSSIDEEEESYSDEEILMDDLDSYSTEENEEIEGINLDDEDDTSFPVDEETEENSEQETSQNSNYFSVSSQDVEINSDILGDVYVCTSGKLTIDAFIYGNVFVCASEVEITNNSNIESSLFCASDKITINGTIDGNTYAFCKDFALTEDAEISLDLILSANKANIEGYIYRDAFISGEEITISDSSSIDGNLDYSSPKEINVPEDVVTGEVKYNNSAPIKPSIQNQIVDLIYGIISFIIFVVILYLIFKWLHAKFTEENEDFVKNLPKYILTGILALIILPIIGFILLMLGITVTLSILIFAVYIIGLMIASTVTIIALSMYCINKFGENIKINNTFKTLIFVILISIIYKILQLLPYVGGIITFVTLLVGYGIIVKSLIPSKQQ